MTTEPVRISDLIAPAFKDAFLDVEEHGHTHYWLKGGRGSTKSTFVAVCIIYLILLHPEANAVVYKRNENTLRYTAYAQILLAISMMGLTHLFKASLSPMRIVYRPTGQEIVFRGADKADKSRGMTFSQGYAEIIWFEELMQFDNAEEIRDITETLMRGGERFWCFYSYNPPKVAHSWVNRECVAREQRADTLVHTSTYLDIISTHPHWLGQPFIDEAEMLKATNPRAYEWEMLGVVTGTGGAVFENLKRVSLTDDDISRFDRVHNGVDFGWFPDPWTMIRAEWVPSERRIIMFEEHSAHKHTPEQTGEIIKAALTYKTKPTDEKATYHDEIIWCDDTADGKAAMATYRRKLGISARPAPKGNMRKQSYYWLAGLREIAIDPKRCPQAWEEFSLCEFKRNRQGDWIDDFKDGNDHFIDAGRYAFMDDIVRSR
jgi:phage terminase large subunit